MHIYSCTSRMRLALVASKLGVYGVPCFDIFSSLFQPSSCVMRKVQFGHSVYESMVGDVVSGRDTLHI